jgi:hypothetical protein
LRVAQAEVTTTAVCVGANTDCVFTFVMVALCALQQQAPVHRRMARCTKRRAFAPMVASLHELRQNA